MITNKTFTQKPVYITNCCRPFTSTFHKTSKKIKETNYYETKQVTVLEVEALMKAGEKNKKLQDQISFWNSFNETEIQKVDETYKTRIL